MKLDKVFGDHSIYEYDTTKHRFIEYFQNLFNSTDLGQLHLLSDDFKNNKSMSDVDSDLHKKFYSDIKNSSVFKNLYCEFVKDIYDQLFPNEDVIIFQSFPSIRIQFFNNIVVPPHYDADDLGKHPVGEKNFIIPITRMYGTNTIFIESQPRKEDYIGIDMNYGDLFYFNGNQCTHFNKPNSEANIRISLDFRVIHLQDYLKYIKDTITYTNPRDNDRKPVKMTIGGYYQVYFRKDHHRFSLNDNWYKVSKEIVQSKPCFGMEEANAVFDYMKTGDGYITEHTYTRQLEDELCRFIGVKHCVMTTSGTSALLVGLMSLDIPKMSTILVPAYTMIATINAIEAAGFYPLLVDVNEYTHTIDLDTIKYHVSKTNVRAVMHVSLNNMHSNINEISKWCNENNIVFMEDAAQSLGCRVGDKHFGTFGLFGCFSLSTPKIISTGQGGFVVTNDSVLYEKMRKIKNFGRSVSGADVYDSFGLNFKFTDIQAIIGLEQMKKIDFRINRLREIYQLYYNELHNLPVKFTTAFKDWFPWFVEITLSDKDTRDDLVSFLKTHSINTRLPYPVGSTELLPNSMFVSTCGLWLPTHMDVTREDIFFICQIIRLFYRSKHHLYIQLSCYSETSVISPWFIPNKNNGTGNMLFQIASGLSYALDNYASLHVPSLNTYYKSTQLPSNTNIFKHISSSSLPENLQITESSPNIYSNRFKNNLYLSSYFENYNNFDHHRFYILNHFRADHYWKSYINFKYPFIFDSFTSTIHVRRGPDYENIYTKTQLDSMDMTYHKLVDYMINSKNIDTFMVLTNDKNYCTQLFNQDRYPNVKFYYSDNEIDFVDMWIISLCKNNILSKSTLSWWGSYLNENSDKFIIGHKKNLFYSEVLHHYNGWFYIDS